MKTIIVRIPEETHTALIERAKLDDRSMQAYVKRLIIADLAKPYRMLSRSTANTDSGLLTE